MSKILQDQTPEIYCALTMFVPFESGDAVFHYAKDHGLSLTAKNTCCNGIEHRFIVAEVYYAKSWHLDETLSQLFEKVRRIVPQLLHMMQEFMARFALEIAFWQYGTYPSLSITGKNTEIICLLKADIDIDPYDGFRSADFYDA